MTTTRTFVQEERQIENECHNTTTGREKNQMEKTVGEEVSLRPQTSDAEFRMSPPLGGL